MESASCPPVDTLCIGPPQCASTPLIKRRPAAAPLQPVSLPGPDFRHVPGAFPVMSPTFFHPAFSPTVYNSLPPFPLTYFPTPGYSLPVSPSGFPVNPVFEKHCSRPYELMTETRPSEAMIPSCPAEKINIGKAVDKMIAQVLGDPTPPSPTTEIKASLQRRLQSLKTQFPTEVKEMSNFLDYHSQAIEKERHQCLKDGLFTEDFHSWLSQRYAEQLHMVLQQVERNVLVLERQKSTNKNQSLGKDAICTMEKWFIEHLNNPYPTPEEAEDMADKGGISVRQLRKWFSNKRNRTRRPRSARAMHTACQMIPSTTCHMN